MLQNGEGEWVQDQGQLKSMAVTFYDDLYSEDNLHRPLYGHHSLFPSISSLHEEEIRKQYTTEDVRAALFEMKPWKAPGVDGIQTGFYQKHWEIVGGDINAEVSKSLSQFRLISLCNVMYKLVTKTIATRLKKLMSVIVRPTESSFVAERHITDNIVIAQEAIHSMRSMKGKHGVMALKVDLEKSYDRVTHEIAKSVEARDWKPFKICKNDPLLSHLFFADDLLLFGKADVVTDENIAHVMDEFCASLGMKVSTTKTTISFSKNVKNASRRNLKELLGVREVESLGKYLGVPLLHRRVDKNTYAGIVDKMKGKIANWTTGRMSLAGRVTLAQSVLSTMSIYAMQTAKISIGTCDYMEKVIRGFVWGKTEDKNRMSLVAWDAVTCPREEGGLGLRNLYLVNNAFGMKVCWEMFNNTNSLWGSILCSKYKFDPHSGFDHIAPSVCTPIWCLICNTWPDMWRNVMWAIGSGKKVMFWIHRWVLNMRSSLP
ncbi:hypothetical protein SASPL_144533 [Salvia splendens]|uniref:Reverse transcriptase domain-containing protein n=1 Tax=Salvia splendens TaxID=180675 RepID=A0A8X8Z6J6_SALSN|nr:hypothetical protein SASPL_144533 [Salvia splendens]